MKLVFALLVAGLSAVAVHSAAVKEQETNVDQTFLNIQTDVLRLLEHVNQPSFYPDFVEIGNSYNISSNSSNYTNQTAVQNFLQYYNYNSFLPRGAVFSVFYREQLQQAIALFRLFYYAKNYETFYRTAVWARQNLNEGLFLYSYTVAVVHRPDTRNIVLPPIYEIYPYYFFPAEVIQQAYIYNQQHGGHANQEVYTITSNFSGYYLNLPREQSLLSYYLEDIGINSYYYFFNVYYPFWLDSEEFGLQNVNRGEQYYFFYQQLLARYYLERLSNGLGEVPYWDTNVPFETPYYPSLEYANGLDFPSRPAFANLYEYFYNYGQSWTTRGVSGYSRLLVNDYERRISDAVDSGYVFSEQGRVSLYSENGRNILGNLIQANPDSPNYRYYGAVWLYASHLLGYSPQPLNSNQVAPSALEQFETALRDPAFYSLYNRVLIPLQRYFINQGPYNRSDLVFPGVEIRNFSSDRLVTYDDPFYANITNAVFHSSQEHEEHDFNVRVQQNRLNNRPFTYRVTVQSERETRAVIRVFLGPRYDEYGRNINISQNRFNFVLLDYFVYELQSGENVISRNSYDSSLYGQDVTSYRDLYRQVLSGSGSQQSFARSRQNYFRFPQRFLLPRGSVQGTPYQFYVIAYPYQPRESQLNQDFRSYFYPYVGKEQFYDSYSLGYPFDRPIVFDQLFYDVPNSYFYETQVYHRENINAVHQD
ncbi:hypothetical protein NQ315_001689 [Exocentrus adspersus]|uniref:Hexamerin n=1 Tax=Exocentrus adspersus TaxID=1586481 RepID=A0AAV8WAN8_9CUCU|nr:hypothetical protein NQ315_001689 [Exocentrus adspersus]